MASPTTPTHGKFGALYRLRPNGFVGNGLNDATLGILFSGADSAFYEVQIMAENTPDTYKWRKNGGAWDDNTGAGFDITGAAQTLDEGQTITFADTTGHTLGDQWTIGNLKDEPCDETSATAQITDPLMRVINPNSPPTFTDAGSKNVLTINYTNGKAVFDGNVGEVTVTGNNGYIPSVALEKVGYLIDWGLDVSLDMADTSRQGQEFKEQIPGMAGASGSANQYFIGADSFFDAVEDNIDDTQKYHLLKLFSYDPDQDQTGDHFLAWVTFNSWGVNTTIGESVKETVSFTVHGAISFKANV